MTPRTIKKEKLRKLSFERNNMTNKNEKTINKKTCESEAAQSLEADKLNLINNAFVDTMSSSNTITCHIN